MLKDIQVTLYDIFGYFLPGAIGLLSAATAFWAVFWSDRPFNLSLNFSTVESGLLVLLAYITGHLVQAAGNHLKDNPSVEAFLEKDFHLTPELTELVKDAVSKRFGPTVANAQAKEIYELCDQTLLHNQSPGDREIFIYREGFYRGLCVSLVLFVGSLCMGAMRMPAGIAVHGFPLKTGALMTLAALSAFGAWLAFERYKRFAKYRIRTCFLRFLALPPPAPNTVNEPIPQGAKVVGAEH